MVEVAGGAVMLVFVIVTTPGLTVTVAAVPSINHVILVRGRLNSVMVTFRVS